MSLRALRLLIVPALVLALLAPGSARAADRTFAPGSLIIPVDLSYQSRGMFQSYGLVYQLLRQGVRIHWIIDPTKTVPPELRAVAATRVRAAPPALPSLRG